MSEEIFEVATLCVDVAALGQDYSDRVDGERILLALTREVEIGEEVRFVVLLVDGTPAFAGAGRCIQVSDQGSQAGMSRFETLLDALAFDERSMPVYEYIVAVRQMAYQQAGYDEGVEMSEPGEHAHASQAEHDGDEAQQDEGYAQRAQHEQDEHDDHNDHDDADAGYADRDDDAYADAEGYAAHDGGDDGAVEVSVGSGTSDPPVEYAVGPALDEASTEAYGAAEPEADGEAQYAQHEDGDEYADVSAGPEISLQTEAPGYDPAAEAYQDSALQAAQADYAPDESYATGEGHADYGAVAVDNAPVSYEAQQPEQEASYEAAAQAEPYADADHYAHHSDAAQHDSSGVEVSASARPTPIPQTHAPVDEASYAADGVDVSAAAHEAPAYAAAASDAAYDSASPAADDAGLTMGDDAVLQVPSQPAQPGKPVVYHTVAPEPLGTGILTRPAIAAHWAPAAPRPPQRSLRPTGFQSAPGPLAVPEFPPRPALDRSQWVERAAAPAS